MKRYLIRRLIYSIISFILLSLIIFLLIRIVPGDPAMLMSDPGASREDIQALREQLGLNRPLWLQYWVFIKNAVTGDFGTSFYYRKPVLEIYLKRLPASIELSLAALAISLTFGITIGIYSAVRSNTWGDKIAKVLGLLGVSMAPFWVGLLFILLFSVYLEWLPTSGRGGIQNLIMPAATLGWFYTAVYLRLSRSSMLEVIHSEYIKFARTKGLPESIVILKHAFKNALIPVFTLAGINLVVMINISVIVETIFAWPGIGRLLFEGIYFRDFPIVQACVLLGGLMIISINLIVDMLYGYIDPRIRYEK